MGSETEKHTSWQLAECVLAKARAKGLTLGTAESCTGGLVCAALTDVPGSSDVVRGGVVSYAVPIKEAVLNVPTSITQNPAVGVVSGECAEHMARGVRAVVESDIAVATTGIAGPGGAEPNKPIGTVWFGIASARGASSEMRIFEGSRQQVRDSAVLVALSLLENEIDRL